MARETLNSSAISVWVYSPRSCTSNSRARCVFDSFGCFPFSPFGAGDRHPLLGAHADQVPLELRHHGEHVEQQSTDGIGGIVTVPAEAECDALST